MRAPSRLERKRRQIFPSSSAPQRDRLAAYGHALNTPCKTSLPLQKNGGFACLGAGTDQPVSPHKMFVEPTGAEAWRARSSGVKIIERVWQGNTRPATPFHQLKALGVFLRRPHAFHMDEGLSRACARRLSALKTNPLRAERLTTGARVARRTGRHRSRARRPTAASGRSVIHWLRSD